MQFTSILASSILAFASGISAAPAAQATTDIPNITLRIFEDISGTRSDATVPGDNVPRPILELFKGSAIANIGFNATSAQLVQFVDSSQCLLVRDNVTIQLDGRAKNFADIDGDRAIAVPTYIGGFTFQCTQ